MAGIVPPDADGPGRRQSPGMVRASGLLLERHRCPGPPGQARRLYPSLRAAGALFGNQRSAGHVPPAPPQSGAGLDYWIAPSIVWQNEFDIELPRAGGVFVSPTGAQTSAGSIPNDHAFLSQFTIGF